MKRFLSKKFIGFIIWAIIIIIGILAKVQVDEVTIDRFSKITALYMLGQSAIDAVKAWRDKE